MRRGALTECRWVAGLLGEAALYVVAFVLTFVVILLLAVVVRRDDR